MQGPFLWLDALWGTCFCPQLTPSGRHAKAYQLNIKDAECRILPLCIFTLFHPIPPADAGLSYLNAASIGRLHTHTCTHKKMPLSSSSFFFSSFILKYRNHLQGNYRPRRAGLLHTNFVRLTSRGQCSVWPLVRALEFILFDWKDSV